MVTYFVLCRQDVIVIMLHEFNPKLNLMNFSDDIFYDLEDNLFQQQNVQF